MSNTPPPPGYGPPDYGPPSGGGVPSPTPANPSKGFFAALFDFGFNHFVTPIVVKVVYVVATIALVLGWLIFTVVSFTQSAGAGLGVLIFGAVGVILYLAFIRMTLEFYLSVVRMSEDIHHRLTPR